MKVDELLNSLDKLSIKLLFLAACLVVGSVSSAVFVNHYSTFFFNEYTMHIHSAIILCLPLAVFILTQISADILIFRALVALRLHRIGFLRRKVASRKANVDKQRALIEQMEAVFTEDEKQLVIREITSLRNIMGNMVTGNKRMNVFIKSETKKLRELRKEEDKWYGMPAHMYLTGMIFKFILLLAIIVFSQDELWLFMFNIIAYIWLFNRRLIIAVKQLVNWFSLSVLWSIEYGIRNRKLRKLMASFEQ